MTTPIFGTPSNLTPNYTKEMEQEQAKTTSSSSSTKVILTKDSLDVPFDKQVSIQSQEADASRPSLPPLFQLRLAEDRQSQEISRHYYQALRNQLSPFLKEKLKKNEEPMALADRDLDLVALDASLKFEAHLLALADAASAPNPTPRDHASLESQKFRAFSQEFLAYSATVLHLLDHSLASLGSNDSSREILVSISNQIKEILGRLGLYREHSTSQE
jgi:hypothetical protein